MPIFAWNVPLVSLIFSKRSIVFPILLFSSISLPWSLRKAFLSLLAILWHSSFKWIYLSFSSLPFISLLFRVICETSSDSHFAFLHFFSWGWSWSLHSVQCHEPLSIVLQALCLSDPIPWMYLSLPQSLHCSQWLYFSFLVMTLLYGEAWYGGFPSSLLFCCLAICVHLFFYRIFRLTSWKIANGILIVTALNMWINLRVIIIFYNVNSSHLRIWIISPLFRLSVHSFIEPLFFLHGDLF